MNEIENVNETENDKMPKNKEQKNIHTANIHRNKIIHLKRDTFRKRAERIK